MSTPQTPLISVIIPVYNAQSYIKATLDSLLRQTYTHFEALVVNDGTPDQSMDIVRQYNDPRIKIIEQENQGVSTARNNGFKAAQGEYIAFLDADDLWYPDKLATDVEVLEQHNFPICLVHSGFYCIDEKNRLTNIAKLTQIETGNFQSAIGTNLFPSITTIHRDIMTTLGGFPDNATVPQEDRVFFIKACKRYPAYATMQRNVLYRQMMSGRALQRLKDYDAMLAAEMATINALKGDLNTEEFELFQNHHLRSLLNRFLRFNAFENAQRHVKQVPGQLLNKDLKGMITRLSFTLNINLLYYCQEFLFFTLKFALAPWWLFKRRGAV